MIYLAGIRFTDYPSVQIRFVFWLVRQDEKMFVTDIDGTITKSDMSGFLLPKLGVDHHHSGTPYSHSCIQFHVSLIHCCEQNFRCCQIPQRDRAKRIQGHLFDCTALGFG